MSYSQQPSTSEQEIIVDSSVPLEKVNPSFNSSQGFAPVPAEQPYQQRAICMVKGRLLLVDMRKNQGMIQVNQENYPCLFAGQLHPEKMAKRVNEELCFAAWPSVTSGNDQKKKSKAASIVLKLNSLRKSISPEKNGYCEIRGLIHAIQPQDFQVSIYSQSKQETYLLTIYGRCPSDLGHLVRLDCQLGPHGFTLLQAEVLLSDPVALAALPYAGSE